MYNRIFCQTQVDGFFCRHRNSPNCSDDDGADLASLGTVQCFSACLISVERSRCIGFPLTVRAKETPIDWLQYQ